MSENEINPETLRLLYTEIGRGHPFYLDGIVEALGRLSHPRLRSVSSSVFDHSQGLSSGAWRSARWLYRRGSSGGLMGRVYARLRRGADYNRPGLALKLLGRDIRERFRNESEPLVVAHPSLVGLLNGRTNLFFQHGEVAVPAEAVVRGATAVFVPTELAAEPFLDAGYKSDQVMVSGLCVEPSLSDRAEDACRERRARAASQGPLTGFFVSSGAEPKQHLTALIESVTSVVSGGGRAVILARRNGMLHTRASELLASHAWSSSCVENPKEMPDDQAEVILALYSSRQEENEFTFRLFDRLDYLVAPAHERSNWALGLGLPMFPLVPSIGPFAPLNLKTLIESGVAIPLDQANPPAGLGRLLERLRRDGSLHRMSESGWGKYRIDGFDTIARYLADRCST